MGAPGAAIPAKPMTKVNPHTLTHSHTHTLTHSHTHTLTHSHTHTLTHSHTHTLTHSHTHTHTLLHTHTLHGTPYHESGRDRTLNPSIPSKPMTKVIRHYRDTSLIRNHAP